MGQVPRRVFGCVVAIASFVLAGCVGTAPPPPIDTVPPTPDAAQPAAFDETTGAIEGLVLDDEGLPIGGADVALTQGAEFSQTTVSALDGRFAFSNIPPGGYQVFAQKLGFQSAGKAATIVAGEVSSVTMSLTAIAVRVGYHDMWSKVGYFDCSWIMVTATGPCGFTPAGNITQVASLFDTHRRAFEYRVFGGVMDVFNEVTWKPGSAATGTTLSNTFSYHNRTTTHWWCKSTGKSPMMMHWARSEDVEANEPGECLGDSPGFQLPNDNQPKAIPYKDGEMLRSFLNTGPAEVPGTGTRINNFGLAFQQHFEIWFSVFYWERAPEGYSAIKDS